MEKTLQEQLIELREKTGMNRKEFAEFFQIPYRTMTDWETLSYKDSCYTA